MHQIINYIKTSLKLLLIFSLITGVIYPLFITGLSQVLFYHKANGSLIIKDKKIIGSEMIGKYFHNPKYFLSRPSSTKNFPYNSMYSGGSNLGTTNLLLINQIITRVKELKKIDPGNIKPIPIELVTASGSGLDPHINVGSAYYQAARIAKLNNLSIHIINNLIDKHTELPQLGFLGTARINVLKLNLELDSINKS